MSGRALALLLVIPLAARAADPDPWMGPDKALHFAASAGLAGLGYGASVAFTDSRPVRLAVGAALSLSAGVAKELWDLSGHGDASWRDLTWDLVGCTVGLAVSWLLDVFVLTPLLKPGPGCPNCSSRGIPRGSARFLLGESAVAA